MTREISAIRIRSGVTASDTPAIEKLVTATGFFSAAEIGIAVELVEERLAKGSASGYEFIIAEENGKLIGYACFGEIPCTVGSYDLYWIVVDPQHQGAGIGRTLMNRVESAVSSLGGRGIYIDTSGRDQYAGTRKFYERCGFVKVADLPDFYEPHDSKQIYWRSVSAETR